MDDRVHNKRRIHVYAQCCVAAFCPILRVLPHVMTMQRSPLTWRGQAPALQLGLLFLPYHACLLFSFYRACHDRRKTLRCFDWVGRTVRFYAPCLCGCYWVCRRTFFLRTVRLGMAWTFAFLIRFFGISGTFLRLALLALHFTVHFGD